MLGRRGFRAVLCAAAIRGPLTQSVEYLPFKQRVAGSNPARPTTRGSHGRVSRGSLGRRFGERLAITARATARGRLRRKACGISRLTLRRLGCYRARTLRPHRLARSRTPAFHAGNAGSNPAGDATFPYGSSSPRFRTVPLFLRSRRQSPSSRQGPKASFTAPCRPLRWPLRKRAFLLRWPSLCCDGAKAPCDGTFKTPACQTNTKVSKVRVRRKISGVP